MKRRFVSDRKAGNSYLRNLMVSVGIFAVILGVFSFGFSGVSDRTFEEEKATLEKALSSGIMHCYAIEGHYPESLDYLKENYGLTYNEALFYVDYQPLGANLMPDVTILVRKGEGR